MHISEDNINFLLIVTAFILNAVVKKLRQWWGKHRLFSSSNINQSLKTQIEINTKLELIRNAINATRVAIINYNPSRATATMTYERVGAGTSELMLAFKDMPTSHIAPLLYELEETGNVMMNSDYHDKRVIELHRAWGIYSTYKFKLNKHKSIGFGCLVIAFDTDRMLDRNELDFIKTNVYTLDNLYNG